MSLTPSCCCSLAQSRPTLSPHGLQHARFSCPSLSPEVCSNSCPLSQGCHPTIYSSAIPFSCLQSFPASGSFPVSQLFASGGQRKFSKCLEKSKLQVKETAVSLPDKNRMLPVRMLSGCLVISDQMKPRTRWHAPINDSKSRGFVSLNKTKPCHGGERVCSPNRVLAQVPVPLLAHPIINLTRCFDIVNPLKMQTLLPIFLSLDPP